MLYRRSEYEPNPPAEGRDRLFRRSPAFQLGVLLGVVHMLFLLVNVVDIIRRGEGRWHMFWMVWGYIDFPVSVLLSRVILPLLPARLTFPDAYLAAYRGPVFAIFLLFHAVVGSAWYFLLPILVRAASRKIASTTAALTAVGVMIMTPVAVHWLQLLRFFARSNKPAAVGLNSILPGVWVVLLVWLLFTNVRLLPGASHRRARRKATLWLLLLVPPVFYYLAKDLYYCIRMAR